MITRFSLFVLFGVIFVDAQYINNGYNNNQNSNSNSNSNQYLNQNQNNQQNQYQQNGVYGSNNLNQNSWGSNNYGNANNMVISTTEAPNTSNQVSVQVQLKGYSNINSVLPNSTTCICPTGSCSFLKTSPKCYFAFTFILSVADGSVQHKMTEFYYLENGQLPQSSQNSWGQNWFVKLPSKPAAIDVFVQHLGPVLKQDGQLVSDDTLTLVDTFAISLLDTLPAVDGVQNMNNQRTYIGKSLGTSLSLSFSVTCYGNLIGPNCDLNCTKSHITTNVAQCVSNSTGYYSICEYVSNGQVDRCKRCPWGVREGTYCQDANGGVLDPREAGFVGSGWQTAAILLIIALFIVTLLFCASILFTCFKRRQPAEKELTTFKQSYDDREPLRQPSPQQSNGSTSRPMLPPQPIKSALRKPYAPLSDDSSFASDVPPVRPSRSEVV